MRALPDPAASRPWSGPDLRDLGVSRREREGPLWQSLRRGVHAWHGLDASDPDVRIAAALVDRPEAVLGGWASLRTQGVDRVDGRTGPGGSSLVPVLLHVGPSGRTRPTVGLDVDRGRLDPRDVLEVSGVRVTGASLAVLTVAAQHGAEEGLVAADAAVRCGLTSPAALADRVGSMGRTRGVPAARVVAALVDRRAASAPESRLRYVWVVEAGLARPEVNPMLVDRDGLVVASPDLLDTEAAMAGEYDGSHHRELRQHTADNEREEDIERLGVAVVRATSVDLWPRRQHLVRRLVDAHGRGLTRDRSRDNWGWVA